MATYNTKKIHRGARVLTYDGAEGTLTGNAGFDESAEEDAESTLMVEAEWDDGNPAKSYIQLDSLVRD